MGDYIEITILVDSQLIADLHETVTSVINQTDKDRLNLHVYFDRQSDLDISTEATRLKKESIQVVSKKTKAKYTITLRSGEAISRSFLYKAKYYLESNDDSFVCPEYSLYRIENTLIIATIKNENMLINNVSACLIDRNKKSGSIPRVAIIKDTCCALKSVNENFFKHLKNLRKKVPHFDLEYFAYDKTSSSTKPALFNDANHFETLKSKIKNTVKPLVGRSKTLKMITNKDEEDKKAPSLHTHSQPYISSQMRLEIEQLSSIKYSLKGYMQMKFKDVTYETCFKSEQLFEAYNLVYRNIDLNNYTYVMILPWLIPGGIDLFAINYLKTIAELNPKENILVLLTNGFHQSLKKEAIGFPDNITLINLPELFNTKEEKLNFYPQLLFSLLCTFVPKRLHIIASKAGYDCMQEYGDLIRKKGIKVIFSSYNYLTGEHGEFDGYTVKELPNTYRLGDIVTTDNASSKNLWVNHYGFKKDDILVHNQLFEINPDNLPSPTKKDGIKILWAAHIRPEKNPDILPTIAEQLKEEKIEIDCYGFFSPSSWPDGNNPLETNIPNLHYKGPYKNFFKDIDLKEYDLFLYTSHADGTPNIIIEAALAGLPIVASKIGGIPDALGENAILVNDTYSSDDFVKSIKESLSNQTISIEKANKLQKELIKKHCKENFVKQVTEMLERSK